MLFSKKVFTALSISLLAHLISLPANAQITETVLLRGKNFKPIYAPVEMPYLVSNTSFDGLYFKVVLGKGIDALSLSEPDETLRLKAATVYYHLNKARDYWINEIHSCNVEELPKITVRIEHTNKFSELGHYQSDKLDPQFNNALSIPAGESMEGASEHDVWGPEIWFRPVKKIRTEDLPSGGKPPEGNPLTQYIKMLAEPINSMTVSLFIQTTLESIFYPTLLQTTYATAVFRQGGTMALMAAILEGSKHADRLFLEKYYYLDTAMIPEVIYHEFAHMALSDHLVISHSTSVNEGMADYFATAISNNPHIASKINEYSLAMPKNGGNKNTYHPAYETKPMANSDFVLSVLWSVRKAFPEIADQLIFNARLFLTTDSSDIENGLTAALLESCLTVCSSPRADRQKLRELFSDRGF